MNDNPQKLTFLHCIRCKYYGAILFWKHGQVVAAEGNCTEPMVCDDTDVKKLIELIDTKSEWISEEYRDATPKEFECSKRCIVR